MSLISVIVPVYKVEPYLNKCIESIVNQTYKNLEIILVDDGSPDHCPSICDLWAEKDPRIKAIHQENSGSAMARNIALDMANGDYISFIDSDDYIAPCFYESLISGMDDETDIVECGYLSTDNDDVDFEEQESVEIYSYVPSEALKCHVADQRFRQTIWNKLYRRRTIGEIRFVPHKRIDDEFFTYQVLGNARKLTRLSAELYAYRQQDDSIMHSIKIEQRIQSVEAKVERHGYICEKFPELKRDSAINLVFTCMYMGQLAVKAHCDHLLPMLKSTLKQYSNDMGKIQFKQRIWVFLAKVSFKMTCRVRNRLHIGL